jgi:hypothetical protein
MAPALPELGQRSITVWLAEIGVELYGSEFAIMPSSRSPSCAATYATTRLNPDWETCAEWSPEVLTCRCLSGSNATRWGC